MLFHEAMKACVHGSILRREAWPLHWWLTVVGEDLPGKPGTGKHVKYQAIVDGPSPLGPSPLGDSMMRGEQHLSGSITLLDALATDWQASPKPPIDAIESANPLEIQADYALVVNGQFIALGSMPASREGYRIMQVLTPQ